MSHLRLHALILSLAVLVVTACSSASPRMKVLGVKAPRLQHFEQPVMKVFVEVHNPTKRHLDLKRLDYRIVAAPWLDATGQVVVKRMIAAGASAVVEIIVPVAKHSELERMRGAAYELDAKLFATSDKTERSWSLSAKGALAASPGSITPVQLANH